VVDATSPSKHLEIARWFYQRALRAVRADSNAATWAALLRAAQNLRYARDACENAAAADAQRRHSRHPRSTD
jgi:hypothetical protein